MSLQILPPDLLKAPDKITTKEPEPYFKPSSLEDGASEEFRLLGCYETGHAIVGWQYPSEKLDPKTGELKFNGYVVTRTYPEDATDIAREVDWSTPDRKKIEGTYAKPRQFLAWVAMSAARSRLEVLFIEQKGLREQLTEVLQDDEDYTFTSEGLANFSIKITRKGTKLDTKYTLLPKIRKVPEKIVKQWQTDKNSIWLPNFFSGQNPFDGRKEEGKGLPAGAVDRNGSTVLLKQQPNIQDEETEF